MQAVNDDVVTGDDVKQFIQMALTETTKMKTMVGDLHAFNSFAVNAVPVKVRAFHVNALAEDIIRRWGATHPQVKLSIATLEEDCACLSRFSTSSANLSEFILMNAEQAMDGSGNIHVSLQTDEQFIVADVKDNGCGISLEEQPFIFERFYRGDKRNIKCMVLGGFK